MYSRNLLLALVFLSVSLSVPLVSQAQALYGGAKVTPAFGALSTSRVDFVGIGDSNQVHSGDGWDHGFAYALSQIVSMYATGLISMNEGTGVGAGLGYGYGRNNSSNTLGVYTGAPSELATYLDPGSGGLSPPLYGYYEDGASLAANANSGMSTLATPDVLDPTAPIIFDFDYGTFTTGSGSFRPSIRRDSFPYTTYVASPIISTNTGSYGMQTASVQLSADAARAGLALGGKWTYTGTTGITGPFFGLYMRASNPDRTNGFSYHTLDARGGQSLRVMATDLIQASDNTLSHYFSLVRTRQGATKWVVVIINSGLNDMNDTTNSVGPSPAASNTGAGFADNLRAAVDRIKAIWTLNGWADTELYFVVIPSHAKSTPENASLTAFRAAARTLSDEYDRMAVVDANEIAPETEMTANSWYISVADHDHLKLAGYEQVATQFLQYLADTTAPAVSVTAPADGARVSGGTVSLTASATDAVGVAGVQFKLDTNTLVGAEDTVSTYGVTWDSTAVADGSHTIIAVARDGSDNYATSSEISITVDNTGIPTITLLGDNPVNLTQGDTYTEAGATADDAVDGDITADIVIGGDTVNTAVAGTYTVTYDVSDSQDNDALQVTREVVVTALPQRGTVSGSVPTAVRNLVIDTNAATNAQIVGLLQRAKELVERLRLQTALENGGATESATFLADLAPSARGEDVRSLQRFLNTHGFTVSVSGPGSTGNETLIFGDLTRKALVRFQQKYGITPSVGIFGPKTRAFVNALVR